MERYEKDRLFRTIEQGKWDNLGPSSQLTWTDPETEEKDNEFLEMVKNQQKELA